MSLGTISILPIAELMAKNFGSCDFLRSGKVALKRRIGAIVLIFMALMISEGGASLEGPRQSIEPAFATTMLILVIPCSVSSALIAVLAAL